jgi:hypothetical protein
MTPTTLLWYNAAKAPLQTAIDDACRAFVRRTGLPPTHVVLPVNGEYPEVIGKLKVEIGELVKPWHLEVYSTYQTGDIACSVCGVVVGRNEAITWGVSHSYCETHKAIARAEVEAHVAKHKVKQLELI